MFNIVVRYHDGREARYEHRPATIEAAMSIALDTADALGHTARADDPCRAQAVEIWDGDEMQLSVTVFVGGLLSDRDAPVA